MCVVHILEVVERKKDLIFLAFQMRQMVKINILRKNWVNHKNLDIGQQMLKIKKK